MITSVSKYDKKIDSYKIGALSVDFENGYLRNFRIHDVEMLRMIYFCLRDQNWETQSHQIQNVRVSQVNGLEIQFEAVYTKEKKKIFCWQVNISGKLTGEISYAIKGKALQDFDANRVGLCILHPIKGIANNEVQVIHSNKQVQGYTYPDLIAPYQPIIDITSMRWNHHEYSLRLSMEGDIFEMEDQRNWGDASYKTYCTPLSLPFPKIIKKGEQIVQYIRFKYSKPGGVGQPSKPATQFEHSTRCKLGIDGQETAKNETLLEKLKCLSLDHLNVQARCDQTDWIEKLMLQLDAYIPIGIPFYITLICTSDYENEITALMQLVQPYSVSIAYLSLLSSVQMVTHDSIIEMIPLIKSTLPGTRIGVGTQYNFTEINRFRFHPGQADYITLSFDPQQHASDEITLFENTETVIYMAQSIKAIYNRPMHISPVLLKRKFNPYATDPSKIILTMEEQLDTRLHTDFAAEWLQELFYHISYTEIEVINIFQDTGLMGIVNVDESDFPVYNIIKKYGTRN